MNNSKQPMKHFLMSEKTHRLLKELAAKRGVTMIEVIDQVVEDYLTNKHEQN